MNKPNLNVKCRECGKEVYIRDYGPEKVCPHCGKMTAQVNIRELHAFFADSCDGSLEEYLVSEDRENFLSGIDYEFVYFDSELCIGDISNQPYSNGYRIWDRYFDTSLEKLFVQKMLDKLKKAKDGTPVHLWLPLNNANSYLNLLYYAEHFRRFDEVYLVPCYSEEEQNDEDYRMWDSIKNKIRLTGEDFDKMAAEWREISACGSEFRIGCAGKIRHVSGEYLDGLVLRNIGEKFVNMFCDVREAIERECGANIGINVLDEIVHRLLLAEKIESRRFVTYIGHHGYYNSPLMEKFRIAAPKKRREISREEALYAACEAFCYGSVYRLHSMLADGAELVLEDEGERVVGRRAVAEKIVYICRSWELEHGDGSNIECDVFEAVEGDDFYTLGELYCVLAIYEKDHISTRRIINIELSRGRVEKIEICLPRPGRLVDRKYKDQTDE